jgi:hypothetical protein
LANNTFQRELISKKDGSYQNTTEQQTNKVISDQRHHFNLKDPSNQREFMDSIAKKLNIKEMSDWYNVTLKVAIA